MELSDLARIMRRQWLAAGLAFFLFLAAGMAAALLPASQYAASSQVLVSPAATEAFNSQVLGVMVANLAALTNSQAFALPVERSLPPAVAGRRVSIGTTIDPVGSVLTITAKSTDSSAVAPWANAFASALLTAGPGNNLVKLEQLNVAQQPTKPSSPARKAILVGAAILALLGAFLAALTANAVRNRLDRAERIHRRFGTEVLGEIRGRRGKGALGKPEEVFAVPDGSPDVAEAFQVLRANLATALKSSGSSSIAVMSGGRGEGRSFVAANLAWAMASGGTSVTLVDADLREPSLHEYLNQQNNDGLAAAAGGQLERLMVTVGASGLRFLPAGVPSKHPVDLIRANLGRVLQDSTAKGNLAVIDAPPLNVVETGIIASTADGVILVVDARRRDLLDVERSLSDLADKGAVVLGVVINRSRARGPSSPVISNAPRARRVTDHARGARPGNSTRSPAPGSRRAARASSRGRSSEDVGGGPAAGTESSTDADASDNGVGAPTSRAKP